LTFARPSVVLDAAGPVHVASDRFGLLEVPADRVVGFPSGLPGFPDCRRFALVEGNDTGELHWLQSVDRPEVAFLCAVPWAFFPEYAFELPDADAAALEIAGNAGPDLVVLVILTTHPEDRRITANLRAPVVVDVGSRRGRQVVLAGGDSLLHVPLPG
jgi:flagellar assembly factor FliW